MNTTAYTLSRDRCCHSFTTGPTSIGLPERGNKRNAERCKEAYIAECQAQEVDLEISAFADFALFWLESIAGEERSTWENYENVVKNHIVPYFRE